MGNRNGTITAWAWDSQLYITIEDSRVTDPLTAQISAEYLGQTFVNSVGFAVAGSYSVEITQIISEGACHVSGVVIPELAMPEIENTFHMVAEASRKHLHVRFAIRDYLAAMTDSIDCAYLCYRAIESISKAIGESSDDKKNWSAMHIALKTDHKTINELVKKYSDPLRHGNWASMIPTNQEQRFEMLKLTRNIIIAYMAYVEALEIALPAQ